jgi:hypothetical protein
LHISLTFLLVSLLGVGPSERQNALTRYR